MPQKYVDVNTLDNPDKADSSDVSKTATTQSTAEKDSTPEKVSGGTKSEEGVSSGDSVEPEAGLLEKVTEQDIGEDNEPQQSRNAKRVQPWYAGMKRRLLEVTTKTCPVCGVGHSSAAKRCNKCEATLIEEHRERFTTNKIMNMLTAFLLGFVVLGLIPCFATFFCLQEFHRPTVKQLSDHWHFTRTDCLIYRIDRWSMWTSLSGMAEEDGRCPPEKRFEYERYRFMNIEQQDEKEYCPAGHDKIGERRRCSFYKNRCPKGYKPSEKGSGTISACYRLWSGDPVNTFAEAVKHCREDGTSAEVASVRNDAELEALKNIVMSRAGADKGDRWMWLGLTMEGLRSAKWETDEPLDYLPSWSIPLIPQGGANCMQLRLSNNAQFHGKIRQVQCDNPLAGYVVCKILPSLVETQSKE